MAKTNICFNAGACYVNLLIMLTDQPEINAKILNRYDRFSFWDYKVFTAVQQNIECFKTDAKHN